MAYEKQLWNDRQVEKPLTFTMTNNDDGTVTLTPAPGKVTNEGDPMSAERMNHMEDGIAQINDLQGVIKTTDFAFIAAQVITPEASSGNLTGVSTVDYPENFTMNNCIVVGLMANVPDKSTGWQTSRESGPSAYLYGSGDLFVTLQENNIQIGRNKSDDVEPTTTANVRIVLMKLPNS